MKTDPTDPPDVNQKTTSALCTYGRDEKYIQNKLHLLGGSSVMLYGVGDGMIPYCCLVKRIPCLLIYDKRPGGEVHQKTIQKFLIGKVQALMEAATPGSRWYRTNTQLGCRSEEQPRPKEKGKSPIPAPNNEALGIPAPKKRAEQAGKNEQPNDNKRSRSPSSSHSSLSAKSKKSKNK